MRTSPFGGLRIRVEEDNNDQMSTRVCKKIIHSELTVYYPANLSAPAPYNGGH